MPKKSSRVSKSCPFSGSKPHREHRSKKGRRNNISKDYFNIRKKQKLEELRTKDYEDN